MEIDIDIGKISDTNFNKETLQEFFKKYNFNNLYSKITNKTDEAEKNNIKISYQSVTNEEELFNIVKEISKLVI